MLDDFDRKILQLVQRNNQLTSTQLSERVGLSPTSIQRRLNKMRSTKVIEADIAVVSPKAADRSLTMLVAVSGNTNAGSNWNSSPVNFSYKSKEDQLVEFNIRSSFIGAVGHCHTFTHVTGDYLLPLPHRRNILC